MSTLDIDIVVVSVVVIAIELVVDNVVAVIAIELVDNAVVVIAIELVDNVVVVIAIELVDTIVLVVMVVVMATELVTSDVLVKLISTHCTNCLDLVLVPVYRLLPFPHLVTVHSCPSTMTMTMQIIVYNIEIRNPKSFCGNCPAIHRSV